jgi:hypothetical protein
MMRSRSEDSEYGASRARIPDEFVRRQVEEAAQRVIGLA